MVCIPCIVIPFLLWFFHKYIQPWIAKLWNPWKKIDETKDGGGDTTSKSKCPFKPNEQGVENGDRSDAVTNRHQKVAAGGGDKKRD